MSSKKGRRKNDVQFSDVTINSFANSKSQGRIKKSAITSDISVLVENDDLEWIDNADLFDEDTDLSFKEGEDGIKTIVYTKISSKQRRRRLRREIPIEEREGVDYRFDVWFAISEHIRPEDIGRFACINTTTLAVTNTPKFWFNLYRRFYKKESKLPQRLQPEFIMRRLYSLRQCVIRSLHYTYEPYLKRFQNDGDPHDLVSRRCMMMWYKKQKNQWLFFFKLKIVNHVQYRCENAVEPEEEIDLSKVWANHLANDEEECKIMQVTCESFCDIPMVMGMVLTQVNVSLAQGLIHLRLHLGFRSGIYSKALLPECSIILDSVIKIQVFDWWHPNYPHFNYLLPISDKTEEENNIFLSLEKFL